jgi:hypothetical protein
MSAPSISLADAVKVIPFFGSEKFKQALKAEDLRSILQAKEEKIRAEEEKKEDGAVKYLNKINNYKLLIEIKDTLINLVPYSNIVFEQTLALTKNMIDKSDNDKNTKVLWPFNVTEINRVLRAFNVKELITLYDSQVEELKKKQPKASIQFLVGTVYDSQVKKNLKKNNLQILTDIEKIELLVDEVIKIIRKYKTPEATLCNDIINKMTNNICVFNFIRHLANLGFVAFLTIESSLNIDLSKDTYKKLYKQLHTNYPYILARSIKADYIESIIISSFDRNLNVINNTNMYTNCEGNKESKTHNQMPQNKSKYLKYKFKYLKLKNQMGG